MSSRVLRSPTTARSIVTSLAALALLCAAAGPAAARPEVSRVQAISPSSPLAESCAVEGSYPDSEVEPSLAVDPRRPRKIVVAWQQDRFAVGGGAVSNVVGFSRNAGRSWTTKLLPGVSTCTGGSYPRATDPWVSTGADGTTYAAHLLWTPNEAREPTAIAVSISTSGGRRFAEPVFVTAEDDLFNDRESLTAHPHEPGQAYAAWSDRAPYAYSVANALYFSRTQDSGRSWSEPRAIFAAAPFLTPLDPDIMVLRDGSLVNVFQIINDSDDVTPPGGEVESQFAAMRSTDDGRSWSLPVIFGSASARAPADPDGGPTLNAPLIPSADATRSGRIFVAWADNYGQERAIVFSRSDDGGTSWSQPRAVVRLPAQGFIPTLAAARNRIGITYYDTRRDRPGDAELTADVRFAFTRTQGRTWRDIRLHGPFDFRSAPTKGKNPFLADYGGLDGVRRGVFAAATAVARPLAVAGRSDVLFARIDTRH